MPSSEANSVLCYIRKVTAAQSFLYLADPELLACFISQRDETAFAAFARRNRSISHRGQLRTSAKSRCRSQINQSQLFTKPYSGRFHSSSPDISRGFETSPNDKTRQLPQRTWDTEHIYITMMPWTCVRFL